MLRCSARSTQVHRLQLCSDFRVCFEILAQHIANLRQHTGVFRSSIQHLQQRANPISRLSGESELEEHLMLSETACLKSLVGHGRDVVPMMASPQSLRREIVPRTQHCSEHSTSYVMRLTSSMLSIVSMESLYDRPAPPTG